MSRPYLYINSVNYSSPILTMTYTYLKLRAGGDLVINGFTSSVVAIIPQFLPLPSGLTTITFSAVLATSSVYDLTISYPILNGISNTYILNT